MKLTDQEVAESISVGNFRAAYEYLHENIVWTIIGDKTLAGKTAVIEFCEKTSQYFSTVKTEFNLKNIIADNDRIAIDGTAKFTSPEGETMNLASCDVYSFYGGKLREITSYCIVLKNEES